MEHDIYTQENVSRSLFSAAIMLFRSRNFPNGRILLKNGSTPDHCIWEHEKRWGHIEQVSSQYDKPKFRFTEYVNGKHMEL